MDYAMSVIIGRALPDARTPETGCIGACCSPCTTRNDWNRGYKNRRVSSAM